ncbi:hypothetical protein RISK_002794 [Rhodopirellula islandica]|uniref:Uncharacterized protein n=1 Tax=Rhodopirellula islandica TaxID=595434 RepID=A0A0J1BEL8_RHOIS|nr:hypothetical protein RISK_002794 [Rhodopirellula islandica]
MAILHAKPPSGRMSCSFGAAAGLSVIHLAVEQSNVGLGGELFKTAEWDCSEIATDPN